MSLCPIVIQPIEICSKVRVAGVALSVLSVLNVIASAQQTGDSAAAIVTTQTAPISWKDSLKQKPEWYGSSEAVRIADNVLLYQHDTGGWSKNIDMARVLTAKEQAAIVRQKPDTGSNIDNGGTYTQLAYLARVYTATKLERHQQSFLKGVDYLFAAQYANGGWPQFYPLRKGYYSHITYNDGAMIGVMKLLRDMAQKKSAYVFVDDERRGKAVRAVAAGIEVILKTQVTVDGKRTVWGAQHDATTLAPAPARKFEPVSLSGGESVAVVRFLMGIKEPDGRVVEAVEAAIAWYRKSKIDGIRWNEKRDPTKPGGFVRTAVNDPQAVPIWARFYEIGTNRPVFVGRDGIIRYNVAEIDEERRNGYQWYVTTPAELLDDDYPAWQKKWRR